MNISNNQHTLKLEGHILEHRDGDGTLKMLMPKLVTNSLENLLPKFLKSRTIRLRNFHLQIEYKMQNCGLRVFGILFFIIEKFIKKVNFSLKLFLNDKEDEEVVFKDACHFKIILSSICSYKSV